MQRPARSLSQSNFKLDGARNSRVIIDLLRSCANRDVANLESVLLTRASDFRSPVSHIRHAGLRGRFAHAQVERAGQRLYGVQDIDWLGMFQDIVLRYGSSAVDLVQGGSGLLSLWPVPLTADRAVAPLLRGRPSPWRSEAQSVPETNRSASSFSSGHCSASGSNNVKGDRG